MNNFIEFDLKGGMLIQLPNLSDSTGSIGFQVWTYKKTINLFFDEYYFFNGTFINQHQLIHKTIEDGSNYLITLSSFLCTHVLIKPRTNNSIPIAVSKCDKKDFLISIDFLFNENNITLDNKHTFSGILGEILDNKHALSDPKKKSTLNIQACKKILTSSTLKFSKNTSIVFNGDFVNSYAISLFLNFACPITFIHKPVSFDQFADSFSNSSSKHKQLIIDYYNNSNFLDTSFRDSFNFISTNNCLIIDVSAFNVCNDLDIIIRGFDFYERILLTNASMNKIKPKVFLDIINFIKIHCKADVNSIHSYKMGSDFFALYEIII